ncbi:DUF348 domain-containing protein [Nakamurella sp. YIM 132087]|uniref:DUF348 domain-containing protein n=1 Tax=Nakamurella alba TaxID=2665158 RepID=A0A7K1FF41_9ACTN|nr:resuscitation-promoting factor [Nakamurella alba]MTD12700.1 DUF348 domain-containing protein [Nakamurella alba]
MSKHRAADDDRADRPDQSWQRLLAAAEAGEPGATQLRPGGRRSRRAAEDEDSSGTVISAEPAVVAADLVAADPAAAAELAATDPAAGAVVGSGAPDPGAIEAGAADVSAVDATDEIPVPAALTSVDIEEPADATAEIPVVTDEQGEDDPTGRERAVSAVDEVRLRRGWRKPVLIGAAAALCLLTAGGGTALALRKQVTLVVDGQTTQISTYAGTVADALAAAGIDEGQHDVLAPSAGSSISDGSTIVMERARKLTLTWNGKQQDVWTTARTVDEALADLGVGDQRGRTLSLSADRSRDIPLDGMAVTATSTVRVELSVGGAAATEQVTGATTVGELLTEHGVTLGASDTVEPAVSTTLAAGMSVVVNRVVTTSVTEKKALAQPADRRVEDKNVDLGTTVVATKGSAGEESVTYRVTTVNGTETARVVTGRKVLTAPVSSLIKVGTRTPEPGTPAEAALAEKKFTYDGEQVFTHDTTFGVDWDGLAFCESTHNPKAVNAYPSAGLPTYGMFQFDIPTWESVGGSGNPMDATPSEQLMRAKLLYLQRGLEPWACRDSA